MMDPAREKKFYHALVLWAEGGFVRLLNLKKIFGSWEKAFLGNSINIDPEKEFELLKKEGIILCLMEEELYPEELREIPHPPHALYMKGAAPSQGELRLAIVGTRKASDEGKRTAHEFGFELGKYSTVVSGLAFGVDKAAHEGCLESSGKTIAVLGSGLGDIYPKSNKAIADRIINEGGTLVSEYPPSFPPLPYRFLERNRIVSGLSKGIVIIEAPESSGSLATARFALDQNREIFVLPGPARHPNYKGSHTLIRAGATLVTEPSQVLESFGLLPLTQGINSASLASFEEQAIVEALRNAGKALDAEEIINRTRIDPSKVNQTLSFLILRSIIKENGSSYSI